MEAQKVQSLEKHGLYNGLQVSIVHTGFNINILTENHKFNEKITSFCGFIVDIDWDSVYLQTTAKGLIYKIHIVDLLKVAQESNNLGLADLCEKSLNAMSEDMIKNGSLRLEFLKNKIIKKLNILPECIDESPSTIGNRAADILQKSTITTGDGINSKSLKSEIIPRFITVYNSPSVYRYLYAGNPEDKSLIREVFESLLSPMIEQLFNQDGDTKLLDFMEPILLVISEELNENYEDHVKEALRLIRQVIIDLSQSIKPRNVDVNFELGAPIYLILRKAIQVKRYNGREQDYVDKIILDGHVINNLGDSIYLDTDEGVLEISKLLIKPDISQLWEKLVKERNIILTIVGNEIERLNPDSLRDRFQDFIDDSYFIMSDDLFFALSYLLVQEDQILIQTLSKLIS